MGGTHLTGAEWTALVPHKGGGDVAEAALHLQVEDHQFLHRLILAHIEATKLTTPETAKLFLPKYEVLYYLAWLRDRPALQNEVSFTRHAVRLT